MFWIIQNDLFQQNQRPVLLETLNRFDIPNQVVEITSDNLISPVVEYDGPIITNGSIMLSNIANRHGWSPGSLFNDNFSYEVWREIFHEHLLNRDAVFTTIADANPSLDEIFVRPLLDDKSFTGKVMKLEAFKKWQSAVLERKGSMSAETKILYSPVKKIGQEHRHFIVDGKVISSSRYKLGGQLNETSSVDSFIVDFAEEMAAIWQPARAFVLDTYVADNEIGIVELGGICHAGFYQADVQKIVMALEEAFTT